MAQQIIHKYKKMKTYPTLYSKDSKNSVRIWFMQQDGEKYRTVSGIEDGQFVTSEWTIAEPKNENKANATSSIEQAAAEIDYRYKKQLKTGYFKDRNDIDKELYVEPTLAKVYWDYEDKIDLSQGKWVLNRKLNGARMIVTRFGCFSRKGEVYKTVKHIEEALKPFFVMFPDAVLDGECFNDSLKNNLSELMSIVRKTVHITRDDIEKSRKIVQFHIFDGYSFGDGYGENEPYQKRFNHLVSLFKNIKSDCIKFVTHYHFDSKEEMLKIYQSFVDEGEEGGILRNLEMPYEHKRTKNLCKIKPTDDKEFLLISVEEGLGNWSGKAKRIGLKMENGEIFHASFKGNMIEAEKMLKEKDKYIGKMVTIYFNGYTSYGIPNFAQFDYRNWDKKN